MNNNQYQRIGTWQQCIVVLLVAILSPTREVQLMAADPSFVPVLSNQQAWEALPKLATGSNGVASNRVATNGVMPPSLPVWARAVAVHMPRTAAAMLELDAVHRLRSPLDPALRARLRWAIAHENHCSYSQSVAIADLIRTGVQPSEVASLTTESTGWSPKDLDAMGFVKLLTTAAPTIPDSQFARLRDAFGDKQVAAMVLLAAYGSFQDRILLGLNLPMEEDGPLPPLDVRFVEGALQIAPLIPPVDGTADYIDGGKSVVPVEPSWKSTSYVQLQKKLSDQRERIPRLPIPTWDDVKANLPEAMAARPTSIRWSLINYGYAPELAIPWTIATRTHWAECPSERILEETLFWVQTRAIDCNYCMGHCEMLLEVAGLDKPSIAKRSKLLAETDWSAFPAAEQRAYAFARKLSTKPSELTAADYQSLEADWGPEKAMGLFWWMCRGLYMTRISDGFQLPLEVDNVFGSHAPKPKT
jgi:alkylhydroperoxidase family enzyme